jgi:DNA polymerase-3 subunit epsilon
LGKTKDIKKRVNQHFTNVGKIARKLQKETKKVTYETTGSELIAILKAYLEQKKNRPRYNHVSKKKLFTHTIDFSLNGTEHIVLDVEKDRTLEHKKMAFNGTEAAKSFLNKINEEFELCPSSLGQEVCMSEQNKGIAENCNEKVRAAFEKYSIQNKDIALTDRGRQTGERSFILIKNGRLQGFGFVDLNHQINNIHILESIMIPMKSDENTTFIVEAYLRKNNRLKTIPLTR